MNADRRDFLKVSAALGGAFALEFSFPLAARAAADAAATEVNAWVVINPDDSELLEDLIVAAVNKAITEAAELSQAEMAKVTRGILPNIPGLTLPGF